MVRALRAQLDLWAADPAITRVVIKAAGERAFSAGGDIRALYDLGQAGRHDEALQFWRDEYPLNAADQAFPQALCGADRRHRDGRRRWCVGAWLASRRRRPLFRSRCRRSALAFFQTWARPGFCRACRANSVPIARSPASVFAPMTVAGRALRRTALRLRVSMSLLEGLTGTVSVDAVLAAFAEPVGEGPILARRTAIDRLFAADQVEDILDALDREASVGRRRGGVGGQDRSDNTDQIAAQPETRAWRRCGAARLGLRNVHARRIAHSVAHHPWP